MFKNYIEGKNTVFFDLDGTVIDSLPYWEEAHKKVYLEVFKDDPPYFSLIKQGSHSSAVWKYVLKTTKVKTKLKLKDLIKKTNDAFLRMHKQNPLEARDGFWELLQELKTEKHFKLALVSNSDREVVDPVLSSMGLLENIFDTTVAGNEVRKRKPSPDIYKKALKNLSLNESEVLVFEDSVSGANAAEKAKLDMIIIWSGETSEIEYPKGVLTFLPDFTSLPGNLDQNYYEALKNHVEELEKENTTS